MSALFQVLDVLGLAGAGVFLETTGGLRGEVHVSGRALVHAETGPVTGRKAFWRMLAWSEGRFWIEGRPSAESPSMAEAEGLEHCLIEGLAQLDEFRRMRARVASGGDRLDVTGELALLSRPFERDCRFVLALVETQHRLDLILDLSPLADLETLRVVAGLLDEGMIAHEGRAVPEGSTLAEVGGTA